MNYRGTYKNYGTEKNIFLLIKIKKYINLQKYKNEIKHFCHVVSSSVFLTTRIQLLVFFP